MDEYRLSSSQFAPTARLRRFFEDCVRSAGHPAGMVSLSLLRVLLALFESRRFKAQRGARKYDGTVRRVWSLISSKLGFLREKLSDQW